MRNFYAIDSNYSYDGRLGAVYSSIQTVFRVWSPCADKVVLNLYPGCRSDNKIGSYPMMRRNGLWELAISDDLNGVYYTYTVTIDGETHETIDIYAKAAGVNGIRGMVVDLAETDPEGWKESERVHLEKYTDAVIYELHVRDFSSDPSGHFRNKGKFLAFTEKNVKNDAGDTIGLDYIASLGVTHIHLLPVFDYQTVDESSDEPQFNWGYDPKNFNLPEGSYSNDPYDGAVRIREFKELILAAHKKNIGVIMDVVYNHTYATLDSSFNRIFPGYYYRQNPDGSYSNGSGCGNEFASERRMARKFIIDSLCYLAQEYKLDGFRFDLMGLIDIDTLKECAKKLREINPDIILYGEGWTGGGSPLPGSMKAIKGNSRSLSEFAMFSDDFRDNIKGNVFDNASGGYINGDSQSKSWFVKELFRGAYGWADSPCNAVNYVEAHDNLTFHDKLRLSMHNASEDEIISADKLGAALVMLSRGIPFIQAGQEFLRSKPLPNGGYEHNSYNSPDSINSLKWNRLSQYKPVSDYYRGLIAIRRKFDNFRQADSEGVEFYDLERGAFIARTGGFLLAVNPLGHDLYIEAEGDVYADKDRASAEPLYPVSGHVCCRRKSILLVKLKTE